MDLMVLDTNLDAIKVVDQYESFIWTDRYYQSGDFELYMPMTTSILDYIKQDYYIQRRGTDRLMIIEKLLIETDTESGDHITVTGRSLESILDRRVIWGQILLTGNLQNAVELLLDDCIINPSNTNRKIPNFIFKASTDPRITALTIEAQYTGDNLYEVIQKICEERGLGFKVTLNENKQFVFELYMGIDRSYDQTEVPYVVFSPSFDNIISSNYMESKSSLKNVALVGGEGEGSARRYTAVGNLVGLNRREMFVDARDISSEIDEDITSSFTFNQTGTAYMLMNELYEPYETSDPNFNSAIVDVSAIAGRTIRISIPRYTNSLGSQSGYGTVLLDSSNKYVSTLKIWDKYDSEGNSRGRLEEYDILLPTNAVKIWTSMFSQTAINNDVYYGKTSDFTCSIVKLSNAEYIEQLRQRGKEDLAENVDVTSFEGQMETSIMYRFGEDFFEGDIVQIMNEYGHNERVRVLEVVTSENEEGNSVYPTFKTLSEEGEETT